MIKRIISRAISSYQMGLTLLGIVERNVVYFEGGLGAQILSYLEFKQKSLQNQSKKNIFNNLKCDLTYFQNQSLNKTTSGLTIWPWTLDRYNITVSSLKHFQVSKIRKIVFSRRRHPMRLEEISNSDWAIRRDIGLKEFLFRDPELSLLDFLQISPDEEFSCLHIRRGDFSLIDAQLVTELSILQLLEKIRHMIDHRLVVISDSVISIEFKKKIENILNSDKVSYLEGDNFDAGLIHDLMRVSKVLICSNSMFSFSAGLLADSSTTVIAPLIFFRGDEKIRNSGRIYSLPFSSAGDFFIFR